MENQGTTSPVQPAVTSTMTRMSNIFASPSDVYTEVASAPTQTSSWLLPLLALLIIAVIATYAVYNNPTLRQQIYDMQMTGMKKAVAEGKMKQDQMERAAEQMENSGPVMFMIIGSGIQGFGILALFFLGALVLWLVIKLGLKSSASYTKTLEVIGLSQWIGVLGGIVTIILMSLMNSMHASPGGALLLGDSFDQLNKGHRLLAAVNIFTLWQTGVCGIGVAKLTGKPTSTGMMVSFGIWAVMVILMTVVF